MLEKKDFIKGYYVPYRIFKQPENQILKLHSATTNVQKALSSCLLSVIEQQNINMTTSKQQKALATMSAKKSFPLNLVTSYFTRQKIRLKEVHPAGIM